MDSKPKPAAVRAASKNSKMEKRPKTQESGTANTTGVAGSFLQKAVSTFHSGKGSRTSKARGASKSSKHSSRPPTKRSAKSRTRQRVMPGTHQTAPPNTTDGYFKKEQREEPQAFFDRTVGGGCNALLEDYNRLRDFIPNDFTYETFKQHPDKNRYKDVACNEKTRVILTKEPPFTSDYIHANFVSTDSTPNKFICTQAPSAVTAVDFWRLVWQEQVPHIIMLCCVMEAGKQKCHQYWPMLAGDQLTISPFTISNKGMLPRIDETKTEEEKSKEKVVSMRLTLTKADNPDERQIIHHQWTSWPDKGVPADLRMAAYLLDAVNGTQHVVIHCSAGIGRTGTLAALDVCIERLERKVKLNVPDVVKKVRTARMYCVQTKMQYVFLHMVLLERCRLKGWAKPGAAQPGGKYDEMAVAYAELVAKEQTARPETPMPPTTTNPGLGTNANAPFSTPPTDTPQVQDKMGLGGIFIPPGQAIPIPPPYPP